jgi:hypothetical protein
MTDTSGTQGQESGNQQGGSQGQESGTQSQGQGQESGQQNQQQDNGSQQQGQQQSGGFDFSTITDPGLRAWAEKVDADAREAREQAARYRNERNTLQTQVTEHQRAQETEQQRLEREQAERDERMRALEQENRDLKVNARVETAAKDARAHNPATVVRMLAGQVELDDKGEPQNLQDLLTSLKQTDPYLFKRQNHNAGEGQGEGDNGEPSDMNSLIRGAVSARRGGGRS